MRILHWGLIALGIAQFALVHGGHGPIGLDASFIVLGIMLTAGVMGLASTYHCESCGRCGPPCNCDHCGKCRHGPCCGQCSCAPLPGEKA